MDKPVSWEKRGCVPVSADDCFKGCNAFYCPVRSAGNSPRAAKLDWCHRLGPAWFRLWASPCFAQRNEETQLSSAFTRGARLMPKGFFLPFFLLYILSILYTYKNQFGIMASDVVETKLELASTGTGSPSVTPHSHHSPAQPRQRGGFNHHLQDSSVSPYYRPSAHSPSTEHASFLPK